MKFYCLQFSREEGSWKIAMDERHGPRGKGLIARRSESLSSKSTSQKINEKRLVYSPWNQGHRTTGSAPAIIIHSLVLFYKGKKPSTAGQEEIKLTLSENQCETGTWVYESRWLLLKILSLSFCAVYALYTCFQINEDERTVVAEWRIKWGARTIQGQFFFSNKISKYEKELKFY